MSVPKPAPLSFGGAVLPEVAGVVAMKTGNPNGNGSGVAWGNGRKEEQ